MIGPPENTREHVVAASRAMLNGDWKKCRDYIVNDKMNAKVWNLFRNSEKAKEMVIGRIQEESLRTYLLMYSTVYTTVSLDVLAQLFELDKRTPTDCLIMHRVEPSRLQLLALHLTDKLTQLADSNEQILEPRAGRSYTGPGAWYGMRQERITMEQQPRANRMNYQILEPRAGRSYTGPGAWYGMRQERITMEQQPRANRMNYQDSSTKGRWNANLQNRRRMEQRSRY
ncbi:unnamed protein product [Gongylonema pulchrum]|uniref:PCI domain-containing protein n=1 Tax=Gongylonema pulchrum TaxID=637853 RepID=A0A3P7NL02_9BILA|nr:unnamed protein product [Gongylonema pulchrum]